MNKKQKNRKLIAQNLRNRMINRRYTTTIKTLVKLFIVKIKSFQSGNNTEINLTVKSNIFNIFQKLTSILDKAVKKNIIHKNTAARKKSTFGKQLSKL